MDYYMARGTPTLTSGYAVFWAFASERQQMYRKRLEGHGGPLTADPVLARNRFTNVYRASDRVSQYLITDVIYDADRSWVDTFARVLVFKIFNRIDTWEYLEDVVGEVSAESVLDGCLDHALDMRGNQGPLYSAAYIMPPPQNKSGPKFKRHLSLLRDMLHRGAHDRILDAGSMADAYEVLLAYESMGPFLSFQFVTDLNYSWQLNFTESEFVVPGPGALRGMKKCIADPGDLCPSDLIRWMMDVQTSAFDKFELTWLDLWGRELQLIDIQNIFCEVDKYTREAHPELSQYAPGQRIKQRYQGHGPPPTAWFPPKWGLNESVPASYASGTSLAAWDQLNMF